MSLYHILFVTLHVLQVVGLTLFDLRRREKVDKLSMVGVNGKKFPDIRAHLEKNIASVYKIFDVS